MKKEDAYEETSSVYINASLLVSINVNMQQKLARGAVARTGALRAVAALKLAFRFPVVGKGRHGSWKLEGISS